MDTSDGGEAALHGDGWAEIEAAMADTQLAQMPPTSDPERLLRYVLQIYPKYAEMEMMTTHLRLYATSLEQDLEQARNHSRILGSEVATEREKTQFLQKYAGQVVKERNELLHTRAKKSKTTGSYHFTWHSCCKKSGEHASDLLPSMAAFRGEKLQDVMNKMRSLEDEVRTQERLRQELTVMHKRAQIENDSKSTADRKHIQQLEKQLKQRAMLYSSMERKLYEVESALARHDTVKRQELTALNKKLDDANARANSLESQCERYQIRQGELEVERDDLQERLSHVMTLKDELATQVEQLSSELSRAQADVDTCKGEIEVLQSEDVASLKNLYEGKLQKLQDEWANREHDLKSQIDSLRNELRVNEALLQRAAKHEESEESPSDHSLQFSVAISQDSWTRQRQEWLRGSAVRSDNVGDEHVGSSLSRSQLSFSLGSDGSDDERPLTSPAYERRASSASRGNRSGLTRSRARSSITLSRVEYEVEAIPESVCDKNVVHPETARRPCSDDQEEYKDDMCVNDPVEFPAITAHFSGEDDEHRNETADESDDDLLSDMQEMLKQFQDRRIQEEQNVLTAEQALTTYRRERDEFRSKLAPAK